MLGYAAEMFDDGKQALAAYHEKQYAILLTDCHMPVMDGFELTETIRKTEKSTGDRLPIVAISASVLAAEIDRCYESGMDDTLAKPLEMPKLKAALRQWMPGAQPDLKEEALPVDPVDQEPPATAADQGSDSPVDDRALKDLFGEDEATFKEIMQDFPAPSKDIVEEIMTAFEARDAAAIGAAGHKLKSSSRSIGAHTLADLCADLEKAGKEEDWAEIDKAVPRLQSSFQEVMEYIDNL
jgi:CheY-like chemotaxis protein/HPt (histidine-containing phosphotransfer) domain-containing protein